MKKKALSLLLIAAMTAALLTGCGKNDGGAPAGPGSAPNPSTNDEPLQTGDWTTETDDDFGDYDDEDDEETIRPNGQIDELSFEESYHYINIILKAFQSLDTDTLAIYADDEEPLQYLEIIKADPRKKEFWEKTVGQWIYIEEEGSLLTKSLDYIKAAWYTDCWKSNAEMTISNVEDITLEQAFELYDTYYEKAPYIINDYFLMSKIWTEDGYVKFDADRAFTSVDAFITLHGLIGYGDVMNAGLLLFGGFSAFDLGYEHIEEELPQYLEFMNGDVERITKTIREILPEDELDGYIYEYMEKYFESEEYRDTVQDYFQENVEILRDLNVVYYFLPVIPDEDIYSEQVYEQLKGYRIVEIEKISCSSKSMSSFNFISYIYYQMKDLGLLD